MASSKVQGSSKGGYFTKRFSLSISDLLHLTINLLINVPCQLDDPEDGTLHTWHHIQNCNNGIGSDHNTMARHDVLI